MRLVVEAKAKVLVIEDNQRWSERLKRTLEENGIAAVTARSQEEAIEFLGRESFQFVTLDLQLDDAPVVNDNFGGWEILKKINTFTPEKKMPTMVITGFPGDCQVDNQEKACKEYGVHFFMPKSKWDKNEFIDIVKGAIRRS